MHEVTHDTFQSWKLRFTLVLAVVECALFGATITGWASIVYVFKQDGVFSHLCEGSASVTLSANGTNVMTTAGPSEPPGETNNSTSLSKQVGSFPTCGEQDRLFSLIFTVTVMVWGFVGLPLGVFFDKFGLIKTRLISVCCGLTGFLMFAWAGSDRYTSYLIIPGALLQVVTNFITGTTCTHMAALAGRYTSTVQALCVGGASSSIIVYLIVKLLHGVGVSRSITMTIVAGLWIIILLYSYFIMPHYKVAFSPSSDGASDYELANGTKSSDSLDGITSLSVKINKARTSDALAESNDRNELPIDEKQENDSDNSTDKVPTLLQCLKTLPCLFHMIWFALLFLVVHTAYGTYNPWVNKLAEGDDDKVNHLTNALAYCQLSSLLISLFPGILTDFFRRKMTDRGDMTQGAATVPTLTLTCLMGIILQVCILVNKINAVYAMAIMSEFTRTFLFATCFSFIAITFRGFHYGTIFGITFFMAGLLNLFQFPLFIWADSSDSYLGMTIVLLVCAVVALCHPVYMTIYRIRAAGKKGE